MTLNTAQAEPDLRSTWNKTAPTSAVLLAMLAVQATDNEGKEGEARFEEHCDEVEESAAWGGQLELEALSKAYQRHITVYSVGMPPVEMGQEFKGEHHHCWKQTSPLRHPISYCSKHRSATSARTLLALLR